MKFLLFVVVALVGVKSYGSLINAGQCTLVKGQKEEVISLKAFDPKMHFGVFAEGESKDKTQVLLMESLMVVPGDSSGHLPSINLIVNGQGLSGAVNVIEGDRRTILNLYVYDTTSEDGVNNRYMVCHLSIVKRVAEASEDEKCPTLPGAPDGPACPF